MKQLRGIRNNNPANIRRGSNWKGLVSFLVDPCNNQRYYDKSFCQFSSLEFGVRALIVLLRTYHYKYKLNTIEKIIHRFAPLCENNTYEYISIVVRDMQNQYQCIDRNLKLPEFPLQDDTLCLFSNPKTPTFACRCLMKSICKVECNFDLQDDVIDKAVSLL